MMHGFWNINIEMSDLDLKVPYTKARLDGLNYRIHSALPTALCLLLYSVGMF